MPRIFRVLCMAIIPCTFMVSCRMSLSEQADLLFANYTGERPGAAVLVIKNGEPIFKKAYGFAHVEEKIAATTAHNFRLASVTKQFTAMCLMQLVEAGKLTYETTLAEIFTDFPAYGRAITIRHLLQHTSGLIDYEDVIPDSIARQVLDNDVLVLMRAQDSTYFAPGAKFRYSNSGYAVLAMIVEKVSGKSFATYLHENIFAPLEMTNSVAYEKGVSEIAQRAMGYRVEGEKIIFSDQSQTSAVLGDGGIYSSIEDLLKWEQAWHTNKLVSSATRTQAFTPGTLSDGSNIEYGFGWFLDEYRGHKRMRHSGSTCGFRNELQRYPESKSAVIILTNRAEPEMEPLANKLADLFLME